MSKNVILIALLLTSAAVAQTASCVPPSGQQLIIYRAGSLTRAFAPLEKAFACQTGIQVKDFPMGSVDAGRQITAGVHPCDLYAPADYLDIDLFMKPAGYANFDIVFAHGRMVLAYSASGLAMKKLPVPTTAEWVDILARPGVTIGGGNPFLDPGAYRAPMIFQLAEDYYKMPNVYNNLLERVVTPTAGATLGKQIDFQFTYEHNAHATAMTNPDYRYIELPDEINMSDPAQDAYYRQHAVVVLPGLGVPSSARTIAVPGTHLAWGITLMKDAPNKENAIKFLQLLLGPAGTASLNENGPAAISPALVSPADFRNLPASLRPLVKTSAK
jgi:molybdate/tungstate transport system substrate-binding protein